MTVDDRKAALKKVDLFASFSDEERGIFAGNIEEVLCGQGEILIEEGAAGEDFFILLQGKLAVYKGKRILTDLTPVDYVGEMAIIEDKPRSATVKAEEESLLLKIPAALFREYLLTRPQALLEIMKILSQRLRLDNDVIVREFEQTNMLIHDMKNLLSLFLFLDSFPVEKGSVQEKYIRYMKMARGHLTTLVEQALANVKQLVIPESPCKNSLLSVIEEMRESDFIIHPDINDKKIVLIEQGEVPEFCFSRLQLRRVLLNLVINAAQASDAGDEIELTVGIRDDHAVVSVKDHGTGIDDAASRKVFDLHYTTKSEGNGLGLPACKQIVEENHGGKLSYIKNSEKGTTFTVSLPLNKPSSPAHR